MALNEEIEFRKQRLQDLLDQHYGGNKADFGRACGFRDGAYIGQMLRGDRAIGERVIEAIEAKTGHRGWFARRPKAEARSVGGPQGNVWSAVMRVVTAFAGQDQAIRNAAAELLAEAVRRPDAADVLAAKIMKLSDEPGAEN
jgi:hypothetical protein